MYSVYVTGNGSATSENEYLIWLRSMIESICDMLWAACEDWNNFFLHSAKFSAVWMSH